MLCTSHPIGVIIEAPLVFILFHNEFEEVGGVAGDDFDEVGGGGESGDVEAVGTPEVQQWRR